MARSPLLRSLVGVAKVAQSADANISRRNLIRSAGFGAAWLATGAPGLRSMARAKPVSRIAVVGAGISGLTTALTLMDGGADVTVFEAASRLGGRMFSQRNYWRDQQVSEWCGELIDTAHVTIQALCQRFGLELDDLLASQIPGAEETYYFNGASYSRANAIADFKAIQAALNADANAAGETNYSTSTPEGRQLDAMSVYDWIETRVPGGHASPLGALIDASYLIEYGAETRDQSALNLVYMLSAQPDEQGLVLFGGSDERFHIRGGNDQLPYAIANALGDRVRLQHRLESIRQRADGRIELNFGIFDAVVLALPFAALDHVELCHAGFDALKLKTIAELGRARSGKLHLQFDHRIWRDQMSNGTSYSDQGYQCSWEVSRAQPGASGILVNYTGGDAAAWAGGPYCIDRNPRVPAAAKAFLKRAEPVFPGLSNTWTGRASASHPHRDANLGLSYSYWRVGQYQSIAGYERVPQGRVFFAGEHCSTDFQGYMEGGAAEGVRAAGEVLAFLR